MQQSLYDLLTQPKEISFNYLLDIKEYKLFQPIIEIKAIEADIGREAFVYEKPMILHMILFVAHCYSLDSPFLKPSDSPEETKILVLDDLEVDESLRERILKHQIPELEVVIQNYISREIAGHRREFITARNIYDTSLHYSNQSYDAEGNKIDAKEQRAYYDNAMHFKNLMFELKQEFQKNNPKHNEMVNDFIENVKSLHVTDLIP